MADLEMTEEECSSEGFSQSIIGKKGKRALANLEDFSAYFDKEKSESSSKMPRVNRELFSTSKGEDNPVSDNVEKYSARSIAISDIGHTKDRFFIEGKVLNIYGTYDTKNERFMSSRLLKTDLLDRSGFSTVTVIFGASFFKKFIDIIVPDYCLRVEGASVCARNPNDGGSIDFSLKIDTTTTILLLPFFETKLLFFPELTIQKLLVKASVNPTFKSTIAFVIVQVDNIQKSEGGVFEQLTIADGPLATDRATLTFVNKRKSLYYRMVDEFQKGRIIPFLARNVGVWKDKSNTLSVLDITVVAPLHNEKKNKILEAAFNAQIENLGYGKEVIGSLHITNFNGTLFVRKCSVCKSQNLNLLAEGAFCYSCGAKVAVLEALKLNGEIQQEDGVAVEVTLSEHVAETVLNVSSPLPILLREQEGEARNMLSEVEVKGVFIVDPHGHVIACHKSS